MHLERMCILLLLDGTSYIFFLGLVYSVVHLHFLTDLQKYTIFSIIENGTLKSLTIIIEVLFLSSVLSSFTSYIFGSVVWCIYF